MGRIFFNIVKFLMNRISFMRLSLSINPLFLSFCFLIIAVNFSFSGDNIEKRKEYLNKLIPLLNLENDDFRADPRIYIEYKNWKEWIEKSGELPPDFDSMPADAELPDPMVIEENEKEVPITTLEQWRKKRDFIKYHLQHWIYGIMPPAPGNVRAKVLKTVKEEKVVIQDIELEFGPEHKAKLTIHLMIPDGEGPFPVFMTQWNHKRWASIAVRRGYIGCIYAGADEKDDTYDYRKIYPEYDFTVLTRRAWGASRCIDYLYTLPIVDKGKIALTGHSRNGKQSTGSLFSLPTKKRHLG